MNWPPRTLVTIIATSIGTRIAPELVTLFPITPWTKTGRKKMAPNIDIATPTLAIFEKVKMLLFHNRSGSTGSGTCISTHTNVEMRAAAAAYRPMICHDDHGYWTPPHTVASSTHVMPAERVRLPQTSIARLRRSFGTCIQSALTTMVTTATGRWTHNSHR